MYCLYETSLTLTLAIPVMALILSLAYISNKTINFRIADSGR